MITDSTPRYSHIQKKFPCQQSDSENKQYSNIEL